MEEKPFRVLLDLSKMNLGESDVKYIWMLVSPREFKTIFDFKRAINKKIPLLQENFQLFLRDGLLLENEKISILREEDTLELQIENSEDSLQECSFQSLSEKNTNIHPVNPVNCDSCSSKVSKKRKNDEFVSPAKQISSNHKQKKKKLDKSPHPQRSSLDNENDVTDITSNSLPDFSYAIFEPTKEKCKKNFLRYKKNIDNVTNGDKQVECALSETFRNDNVSCALSHLQVIEENAVGNQSDLSYTNANSEKVNLVNEISQREQKIKSDSKSKTFRSNCISNAFTHSLEIEKSVEVSDSSLSSAKTNSQIVRHENESSQKEGNLETVSPKQNEPKKKKRRRKRKQKAPEICVQSTDLESGINTLQSIMASNNTHNTSDKRKHIIYKSPISSPKRIETVNLDPDPITYSELQDSSVSITKEDVESAGLSGLDMCIARFVKENKSAESISENKNTSSLMTDISLKASTPYPKKKLNVKSWGITPLPENSNTASNTFIIEDCKISKKERTFKLYTEYPSLNYLPPVGTRIAFKTLELNEKYCPEVTDYKEGTVKNIDPNSDEITIELVQPEVIPGRIGKFEILKEDEIPPNEIIKTVSLSWSALISPRLIS